MLGYMDRPRSIITPLYTGDLNDFLHKQGAFQVRPADWTIYGVLDIAQQVASALYSIAKRMYIFPKMIIILVMHTMNIIHRDTKTKNILLEHIPNQGSMSTFPYKARLCDFGTCKNSFLFYSFFAQF